MKVKMTRNVGVRGRHYRAGEVADIAATDAKTLVTMGKAQMLAPPEPRGDEGGEPVTAVDGIGPKTAGELAEHGVETVADLAAAEGLPEDLAKWKEPARELIR